LGDLGAEITIVLGSVGSDDGERSTWCRTPAAASAARRLRPEVSKNSSTALSSNEGELATIDHHLRAGHGLFEALAVMLLTPVLGEAATTSWPRLGAELRRSSSRSAPVPPMTTIFHSEPPSL